MTDTIPYLENFGFSGIIFTSDYAFKCDQIGQVCPCCSNTHNKNNYYVNKHAPSGVLVLPYFVFFLLLLGKNTY